MKPKLLLFLLLLGGIAYAMYIYQGPDVIGVDDRAPDFSVAGRNGSVSLHDYKGKVVLLNFWATWCPPCVHEMPSLEQLHQQMKGQNFEILAVSVDEGGWGSIDQFIKRLPITLDVVLDARGDVSSLFGTYQLPESYLIDRNGVIVKKYIGPRDWMDPSLVSEIESYVQGS